MFFGGFCMAHLVTDYLDEIIKKYPDKIAFIDNIRKITFLNLYRESKKIEIVLLDKKYYKKPILVIMDKSISLICSFLGTAYSGNFYSPVDTRMPKDRVLKILNTLDPVAIITDKKNENYVRTIIQNRDIIVYEEAVMRQNKNDLNSYDRARVIDTDILYVLFTSGSTGIPKGVIINHRAVVDFIEWISSCYKFDDNTIFANQAQLYFDLSIQDVYAPLRNGSTTVLIPNRLYSSPVRVWKEMIKYNVNTLVWIPSMLSLFANLNVLDHVEKAKLKTILFCGEVMPMKQLNYWIKHYPSVVYGNLYGPTECTEACTYYTLDRTFNDDDVLPMGKPCENSDIMIIGEDGSIISTPGFIGELCIRGTCLSDGYYGDIKRTREVFVQNPLNHKYKELIYKTGDLVCLNEYDELIYVSRKDYQIKIRGYRVELGEIEAVVSAIDRVTYNCCLYNRNEEKIILVYTGNIEESELRYILEQKLQNYMIPTKYIHREYMLFNINGKVDRKALSNEYIKE